MNKIAYLTSFVVLNEHLKSFSVPSRHRYIVCIILLLSNRCFETYLVLNDDPFSTMLKWMNKNTIYSTAKETHIFTIIHVFYFILSKQICLCMANSVVAFSFQNAVC